MKKKFNLIVKTNFVLGALIIHNIRITTKFDSIIYQVESNKT